MEAKEAVEHLKALPGQDVEALEALLSYAREQHNTGKKLRALLADARIFAQTQPCFCEAGRKCGRCSLVAKIGKVLG